MAGFAGREQASRLAAVTKQSSWGSGGIGRTVDLIDGRLPASDIGSWSRALPNRDLEPTPG
jgi:hypothetical protein